MGVTTEENFDRGSENANPAYNRECQRQSEKAGCISVQIMAFRKKEIKNN